jgi:hypothetical protein
VKYSTSDTSQWPELTGLRLARRGEPGLRSAVELYKDGEGNTVLTTPELRGSITDTRYANGNRRTCTPILRGQDILYQWTDGTTKREVDELRGKKIEFRFSDGSRSTRSVGLRGPWEQHFNARGQEMDLFDVEDVPW